MARRSEKNFVGALFLIAPTPPWLAAAETCVGFEQRRIREKCIF